MNKVITLIILAIFLTVTVADATPTFYRKTTHKTIKRMTKRQVKESVKGRTLYERHNGKVIKNRRVSWSTIKKPKSETPYWHKN